MVVERIYEQVFCVWMEMRAMRRGRKGWTSLRRNTKVRGLTILCILSHMYSIVL